MDSFRILFLVPRILCSIDLILFVVTVIFRCKVEEDINTRMGTMNETMGDEKNLKTNEYQNKNGVNISKI